MNTTQLECFMAVSNFLNFSRAAESLRLTQPAVSHQISALEDELGVRRLFQRTSKSVRLTQQGYLFTQYAGEMLKLTRTARIRLQESRLTQPKPLGIGCRSVFELKPDPAGARPAPAGGRTTCCPSCGSSRLTRSRTS